LSSFLISQDANFFKQIRNERRRIFGAVQNLGQGPGDANVESIGRQGRQESRQRVHFLFGKLLVRFLL
jgi:hypothetical protein